MNPLLRPLACITFLSLAQLALAGPLACPAFAPSDWAMKDAKLESVRVLSFPPNEPPVDTEALPTMVPVKEWENKGILYQTWNMNVDAPAYKYQVDCLYTGTERYVRLDAPMVKQCFYRHVLRTHKRSLECR